MKLKALGVLFLVSVASNGAIVAAEIDVLDKSRGNAKVTIEVALKHTGSSTLSLTFSNPTGAAVTFDSTVYLLLDDQFRDFPATGSFQLKAGDGRRITIRGEWDDGFFLPSRLRSSLPPVVYTKRGEKPPPEDYWLRPFVLKPADTTISFDCKTILGLVKFEAQDEAKFARFARVRLTFRVAGIQGGKDFAVTSDWFEATP